MLNHAWNGQSPVREFDPVKQVGTRNVDSDMFSERSEGAVYRGRIVESVVPRSNTVCPVLSNAGSSGHKVKRVFQRILIVRNIVWTEVNDQGQGSRICVRFHRILTNQISFFSRVQ